MTKIIQNYFKQRRLAKGLNTSQLAKLIGYKNLNKGSRRINDFELGKGEFEKEYIDKIIEVLEIDREELEKVKEEHLEKAQADFDEWYNQDVPNEFYFRAMATIYVKRELSEEAKANDEKAIEEATNFMKETGLRIGWLYLAHREVLHINGEGKIIYRKQNSLSNCGPEFGTRIGGKWIKSMFTQGGEK